MRRPGLAQGVIDALPEPAFLLTPDGGIVGANRAARRMAGSDAAGGNIADLLATPAAEVARLLGRSRRTSSPLPGALVFRAAEGDKRLRVHAARLTGIGEVPVLLLRCADSPGDRFSILTARVRHLDAELRRRVREKEVLREALDNNRNLMRELQHRVKNNIQMMISLLSMSAANTDSDEIRSFVGGVKMRFRALGTTQDLIYEAQSAGVISARKLFGRLADALADSMDVAVEVEVDIADVLLSQESAHCLALIANELVTNSVKHGLEDGACRIRIALERDGDRLSLVVVDNGKGYPEIETLARSSGLTLIRGLCRQMGASLELGNARSGNERGARSVVSFTGSVGTTGDPHGDGGHAASAPAAT